MPLFEVTTDELVPFRRVQAGPELYEAEIEDLMWDNLEAFTGRPLFRVCRQRGLSNRGRPDIIALDGAGHVHVIEIKRDIDRGQLAQCLEYAGWARTASLDDLAAMFYAGSERFFSAWMEFTESDSPQLISPTPRLTLVARGFDERTGEALSFLTDSNLPITVLRVVVYEDQERRRFIDVEGDHEPVFDDDGESLAESGTGPVHLKIDGRRVQLTDLIDAGLLTSGERLSWRRPRTGEEYVVEVADNGLLLPDGRVVSTPSRAAMDVADVVSYDGWYAWRNSNGEDLHTLRLRLLSSIDVTETESDGE